MNTPILSIAIIIGVLLIGLVVFFGVRAAMVLLHWPRYAAFWRREASKPIPKNALRLLALGDSTMQAVGARRPMEGVVGRAADDIAKLTGRPVHVTNLSKSGALLAYVLQTQLPQADFAVADVVIVSVSANDVRKATALSDFERDLNTVVAALPPRRSIITDVPNLAGRTPYQAVLKKLAQKHGLPRADVISHGLAAVSRGEYLTAGDFFHPSSKGYYYWYQGYKSHVEKIAQSLQNKN